MAINAEQLNIILAARDKEFTKAMDRANRRVENFARKSQKELNKTTKAFSGMKSVAGKLGIALSAGAVVTGFTRLIDNASRTAKELQNLARISGTNVEDFQKFAFASRTVGIEQDKLADILKDVNDKFGDYFATGAGPLKDFFENIAPKVGVTAKAFQGLSSDQALGLYVKTLQDAGVNQQELTFYMEALASDATALSPLLLNNASAMTELGERAQDLGVILDQDLIAKSAKLRQKWDEVMGAMSGRLTEFALYALEIFDKIFNLTEEEQLNELGKKIGDAAFNLKQQQDLIKEYKGSTLFNSEEARARAIENATQALQQNVIALQLAEAEYDRFFKQLEAREELRASLEGGGLGGSTTVTGGTSGTTGGTTGDNEASAGTTMAAGYAAYAQSRTLAAREAATAAAKAAAEEAEIFENELSEIFEPFLTEAIDQSFENSIKDLTPLERDIKRLERRRDDMIEKARRAYKDAGKELDGYDLVKVENIAYAWFHAQKAASEFEYSQRAARAGLEETADTLEKVAPKFSMLESSIQTFEDGLTNSFMRLLDGTKDFEEGIRDMAREVIKELYRVLVMRQMVGAIMGATGLDLFSGPSTGSFGLPFGKASGGPVQAGQPYTVGEHGRELFVPQTAGRILSVPQTKAAMSGGGEVTVVQNINVSTGVQQTVRTEIKSLMPQIAASAKAAVVDAKRRGGSYGRALA